MGRTSKVVRTSILGIVLNLILVGFKAFVGLVSGSISILSDAFNNLSDTISSLVTIFGVIIGGKKPDKGHPHGHKHFEHLSVFIIALVILGTASALTYESMKKIAKPEVATFDVPMLIIIFAGILVKIFISIHFSRRGKKLKSHALIASGKDAMFDVVISTGTLVGALISYFFNISIDGWIGVFISVFMFESAIEIAVASLKKYKKAKK